MLHEIRVAFIRTFNPFKDKVMMGKEKNHL